MPTLVRLGLAYSGEKAPDPNDYTRLRQSAENADLDAQYQIGLHFCLNTLDPGNMVEWFRRAAEQGHTKAELALGLCFKYGAGVQQDSAEAVKWFRKAGEQGDADAQFRLGRMYAEGKGVQHDNAEAIKWFRKAAGQGNDDAQYVLGLTAKGEDIQPADANAVELYRKADAHALFRSGQTLLQYGIPQAVEKLRKAAEQGDAMAQFNLGYMYDQGEGVEKDNAEAVKWYRRAAVQGNAGAQFRLGYMYFRGDGVVQSKAEAFKWWRKAAEQGDAGAQYNLGIAYYNGQGVKKDLAEAAKWFRKAAEQGHADAQNALGLCYVQGTGVEKNPRQGVQWFRRAAVQGHALSQMRLAICYSEGTGVLEDRIEAYKWALLAGMNGANVSNLKVVIGIAMLPEQIAEAQRLARDFIARKEGNDGDNAAAAVTGTPAFVRSSGTGFFVSTDGLVLTAQHVVDKAATIKVQTAQGLFPAHVLFQDAATDLAVLKMEGGPRLVALGVAPSVASFEEITADGVRPSLVALAVVPSLGVRAGDSVFTVGFPNVPLQGTEPKYTEGTISSLTGLEDNPRCFQISIPVQPGNSGGPLVNANGDVVGVVNARLNDLAALATSGMLPQNVNYAVKSSFVLPFLESIPSFSKPPSASQATGTPQRSAVIEQVKKAVVLVLCY